jgi:hypothetical protein
MDLPRVAALASAFAVLGLLLLAGYWFIKRARTDALCQPSDARSEELAQLQAAYESGQMSTEEFERVRQSLQGPQAMS